MDTQRVRAIYEFSEACPRPRPQLNVRLRPRPSADAQKACGRVCVCGRVRVRDCGRVSVRTSLAQIGRQTYKMLK